MLRSLRISGKSVDILPKTVSTEYSGRKLCLGALHDTEINARLDKAWRKLMAVKPDLCGRHVRLNSRLKLFNATVTPTFLYGSSTWALTANREKDTNSAEENAAMDAWSRAPNNLKQAGSF